MGKEKDWGEVTVEEKVDETWSQTGIMGWWREKGSCTGLSGCIWQTFLPAAEAQVRHGLSKHFYKKKIYIYICKSNFLLLFMRFFFYFFYFFYEKPWLDSCHVNSQWKYQHLRDYNDLILGDIKKVANKDFSLTHLECKDNFIIPFFSISRKLFFKTSNYIIWLSCRF